MNATSPPPQQQQPDPAHQLQLAIHRQVAHTLRGMLPPPVDDTPEARDWRDRLAISEVAAMVPANPMEANLATLSVVATAHAGDCFRLAVLHAADPKQAKQLHAQAASMGRDARGYCATLLRMQAARLKREANDTTRESAAWTEHRVLTQLTEALESLPPAPPAPAAAVPAPPPQTVHPIDYDDWPEEDKRQDRLQAAAGRYAILNTERVKRIRQLGGLPPDCDYEPPPPEVLHEIIHGTSSDLRWADTYEPWVPPA